MVIIAGIFLAAAVTIVLLAPLLLTIGHWQVRHPRTALLLWFCAFFVGVGLAGAAAGAAILCAISIGVAAGAAEAVVFAVIGWLSLGLIAGAIAVIGASAEPLAISWRHTVRGLELVAVDRDQYDGFTLVWFESEQLFACAVPSKRPEIFISTALKALLDPAQLRAVIEHERAHLREHHGWAVRIAEINACCLPRCVPAGRALKRATLLLVELIADDAAARRAGAVHLANALARIEDVTGDPSLLLRAQRLTLRRHRSPTLRRQQQPACVRT